MLYQRSSPYWKKQKIFLKAINFLENSILPSSKHSENFKNIYLIVKRNLYKFLSWLCYTKLKICLNLHVEMYLLSCFPLVLNSKYIDNYYFHLYKYSHTSNILEKIFNFVRILVISVIIFFIWEYYLALRELCLLIFYYYYFYLFLFFK